MDSAKKRLSQVSPTRGRNKLVNNAVRQYIHQVDKANLRMRLKESARAQSSRDQTIAQEWFNLKDTNT